MQKMNNNDLTVEIKKIVVGWLRGIIYFFVAIMGAFYLTGVDKFIEPDKNFNNVSYDQKLIETMEWIQKSTIQVAFLVIPLFLILIFYTSFTIFRVLKRDFKAVKRCDFWRYYFPLILLNCILLGSVFFIGNVWNETDYGIIILHFMPITLIAWSVLIINIRKLDLKRKGGLFLLLLGLIGFFVPQGYYIYKTFNPAIRYFSGLGYQTLSKILPCAWYVMVGITIFIIWKIWEYLQYEP